MGKIWMPGGSYTDLDVTTAGPGDVLAGKVIVDKDGNPLTGNMPDRGAWTSRIGVNGKAVIPAGYHNGSGYVDQAINDRGAVNASLGINGTYTIPEGYHNGAGKVTQSIAMMEAQTVSPGTSAKTLSCSGKYMTGNVTVPAVNIPAAYIKRGQVITFPDGSKITGEFEGYVAGNGEIYNWGAIGLGGGFFKLDAVSEQNGTLGYFTTYMEVKTYYITGIVTNGKINITPYTRINAIISSADNRSSMPVKGVFYTSQPDRSTVDNSTGYAPVVLNQSLGRSNAMGDTTTVISCDISMVNTECHVGILFDSMSTGAGNEQNRIYKIWLS